MGLEALAKLTSGFSKLQGQRASGVQGPAPRPQGAPGPRGRLPAVISCWRPFSHSTLWAIKCPSLQGRARLTEE